MTHPVTPPPPLNEVITIKTSAAQWSDQIGILNSSTSLCPPPNTKSLSILSQWNDNFVGPLLDIFEETLNVQIHSFCYRDLPFQLLCKELISFDSQIWVPFITSPVLWQEYHLNEYLKISACHKHWVANQFNIFVQVPLAIVWPATMPIWDKWFGVTQCQQPIFSFGVFICSLRCSIPHPHSDTIQSHPNPLIEPLLATMYIWDKWFGVTQCQLVRFFNLFFWKIQHSCRGTSNIFSIWHWWTGLSITNSPKCI